MANIDFDVAEVLDYDRTYNYIGPDQADSNVSELFALKVRSCSGYFNNKVFIVKPSNINIKQIPLIGEFVLIYKTFNQESTSTKWREVWYYVTSIDVQSSINENMLPGISDGLTQDEIDKIKPGKNFVQKSVSPIQPYEGDFIIEGRSGNSIRFGSTVDLNGNQTHYHVSPPWRGTGKQGDPIIILSNGHVEFTNKKFTVENIQQDAASLYLTSTQKIPDLLLGNKNSRNSLSRFTPGESQYSNSQFIGTADRVILKAKTDIAVIDSPTAIILNTTGDVKIGSDSANESMVHGDVLLNILQKILNQLSSPIQCGTMTGTFLDKSNAVNAQKLLQELLSSTYFINKNTY